LPDDVLHPLADLFLRRGRGIPAHLRPDSGPEFCAKAVREWRAKADGMLQGMREDAKVRDVGAKRGLRHSLSNLSTNLASFPLV
jgi:hypothetical protein